MPSAAQPTEAGPNSPAEPFSLKDCALVSLATGRRARLLPELRAGLAEVDAASLYHHFWGSLLQPRFEEREYNNDFAAWVRHGLHEPVLAERLAALEPSRFKDLESLRGEMLEQIDGRLDEAEDLLWARSSRQFEFVCSQIVVFDTGRRFEEPAALGRALPGLPTSCLYYHFIDARRRTADGRDDFSGWLASWGERHQGLRAALAGIDPWFGSLRELREAVAAAFHQAFGEGPA